MLYCNLLREMHSRCYNHRCDKGWDHQSNKLRKCKNCRMVCYCNRICQKKDWKTKHRTECKGFKVFRQRCKRNAAIYGRYFRTNGFLESDTLKSWRDASVYPYLAKILNS